MPYRGNGATGLGKPLKLMARPLRAEIPIYLAAFRPRSVELTAEIADGWLPIFFSPEKSRAVFPAPFERDDLDIAPSVPALVSDDVETARDALKGYYALYIGGMGARGKNFYNDLACEYGFEEAAMRIQDLYLDGKHRDAAATVPDELVDELALVGPRSGSRSGSPPGASRGRPPCSSRPATRRRCARWRRRCDGAVRPEREDGDRHRRRHRDRPTDGRRSRGGGREPRPLCAQGGALRAGGRRARGAPGRSRARPRDVRDAEQVRRVVERTVSELGGVDVLVNNAGTVWGASPEDMPLEGWQKVVDVNLTGVFLFAQAAGRTMIERGDGGAIVNIASVAGLQGGPPEIMNTVVYNASEGRGDRFHARPCVQVGAHGIRVNAIAPGWFPSDMSGYVLDRHADTLCAPHPARALRRAPKTERRGRLPRVAASAYVTGLTRSWSTGANRPGSRGFPGRPSWRSGSAPRQLDAPPRRRRVEGKPGQSTPRATGCSSDAPRAASSTPRHCRSRTSSPCSKPQPRPASAFAPIAYLGELGGREAFAMERVDGETIGRRIARNPPPGLETQLADELAKIHAIPPERSLFSAAATSSNASTASSTRSTTRIRRSSTASGGSAGTGQSRSPTSSATATSGSATWPSPSAGSSTSSTGSSPTSPTRGRTPRGRSSARGGSAPTSGVSAESASSAPTSRGMRS